MWGKREVVERILWEPINKIRQEEEDEEAT